MNSQGRLIEGVYASIAMSSPVALAISARERLKAADRYIVTLPANAFVLESGAVASGALGKLMPDSRES